MCVNSRQANFVAGRILRPHPHYVSVSRHRNPQWGVERVMCGYLNVLTKPKCVTRAVGFLGHINLHKIHKQD